WLSPAVGSASYPLQAFGNRSLHEVIIEQLVQAGIRREKIEVSQIDTAKSNDYFSHSQYLAGQRESDGRFAIVAMMRD
ncbi:MAG: laccase domain-containing protein, partial [Candidatus Saccharimonadales bacterium]